MLTNILNKRQEIILQHFAQSNCAYAIADILVLIKPEIGRCSRITIVRDIGFLVENGFLSRTGAGRAIRYHISVQYKLFEKIDIEKYFDVPQDQRVINKRFNFDIFKLCSQNVFTASEQKQLFALHAEFKAHLQKIASKTIEKKEFERILIEFSWKSSQIEGNTYSLLDTEALIKTHRKAAGKTREEARMILNHKIAFDFIIEHQREFTKLSRARIEHVHALLIDKLHIAKSIRRSVVGITGTNYQPLDNEFQIKEALLAMIDLINSKKAFFEKAFLSLVLLSYIQAFDDGNKRTARLIANAILLAHHSIPISYRAINETEYKKASILFYEQNNLSYFKHIFISQYEFAVKNYFLV